MTVQKADETLGEKVLLKEENMRQDLEKILVMSYPDLCQDYLGDIKETCFGYIFECDDGWFDLIDSTLNQVSFLCKKGQIKAKIAQVKSKFGSLVIYLDFEIGPGGDKVDETVENINKVISLAHEKSSKISEISGLPASKKIINNWVRTLTDSEAKLLVNEI